MLQNNISRTWNLILETDSVRDRNMSARRQVAKPKHITLTIRRNRQLDSEVRYARLGDCWKLGLGSSQPMQVDEQPATYDYSENSEGNNSFG